MNTGTQDGAPADGSCVPVAVRDRGDKEARDVGRGGKP
jgi:hypothetical protein